MPAQILRQEIMDEDQLMKEVLDKFVNCHEQTYEEFLSTFTYLSKGTRSHCTLEICLVSDSRQLTITFLPQRHPTVNAWICKRCTDDNVAKGGTHGTDSSENIFTTEKWNHKIESNGRHFRNTTLFLHASSEYSEEDQIVIDEGHKVGSSFQGDMTRAGKVKFHLSGSPECYKKAYYEEDGSPAPPPAPNQEPAASDSDVKNPGKEIVNLKCLTVDNFLDLEDVDMEEESKPQMNKDWLLLPGEVEQDISTSVPAYVPSVDLPLTSEVKPKPAVGRTQKQTEEILGDEVQPFFLDEEFDYDNVTLTPKFTAGEIAAIQELSKQKRVDTSTDLCELHD